MTQKLLAAVLICACFFGIYSYLCSPKVTQIFQRLFNHKTKLDYFKEQTIDEKADCANQMIHAACNNQQEINEVINKLIELNKA